MVPSHIRAVEFLGACAAGYTWWPELRWINPFQAVEFPGACAAGHKWCGLKSGRLNFRVPVLLGAFGALSHPGG